MHGTMNIKSHIFFPKFISHVTSNIVFSLSRNEVYCSGKQSSRHAVVTKCDGSTRLTPEPTTACDQEPSTSSPHPNYLF